MYYAIEKQKNAVMKFKQNLGTSLRHICPLVCVINLSLIHVPWSTNFISERKKIVIFSFCWRMAYCIIWIWEGEGEGGGGGVLERN